MADYSIYETESGRIVRQVQCEPEHLELQVGEGRSAVSGAWSDLDWYVVDGQPVARPALSAEDMTVTAGDTVTIADDLPGETFVAVGGEAKGVVDDGLLAIATAEPGMMHIQLTPPFPWQPRRVTVIVTQAI